MIGSCLSAADGNTAGRACGMQEGVRMKYCIPDCFWPVVDKGSYMGHEAISILNMSDHDIAAQMTIYFEDREKLEGFRLSVPAERTIHFHTCDLKNGHNIPIPRGVGYAAVIECDEPIVVQYTRVDTTQSELGLATTMAVAVD
ncbi:hypothetical protein D7V94_02570 [Parablautia intestinalis]|uniref:Sensory rhodopsin transducer n=2 Tax=Parablautia intestinalis TaxID=2320100 RepID=A0A3A9AQE7_9FIRM|nr:hypothetical protein D7V94_02570 [Parablautia intestinalis]